jgi:hypothetical protein
MLKKVLLYAALLLVFPVVILEGVLRLFPVSSPPYLLPVSAQHPVARYQPNVEYQYSWGPDFAVRARKRSNNFGYTHAADYRPEARTPLLVVIGDSFVEAQAVDAGRTAPELLHAGLRGAGRVYSIGVSGAPLSQYLVFAQYASRTFRPDAMAFVIISNDFDESLIQYKSEPRFHYFDERPDGVALRRVDYALSPAKQFLRHSAFLRYVMYNLAAEHRLQALLNPAAPAAWASRDREPPPALERRVRDSERAVQHFFERLPAMSGLDSRAIVFVLDAVRPAIYQEETLKNSETSYHARMRRYFAAAAQARGYAVLDLQPVFIARNRQDGSRFEFPSDSHWNELGHRVIAEELRRAAVFRQLFPGGAPEGLGPQADARAGKH